MIGPAGFMAGPKEDRKRPSDPPPTARRCSSCKRMKDDTGETYGWGLCQCGSFRYPDNSKGSL
jgi:hypothetical protein